MKSRPYFRPDTAQVHPFSLFSKTMLGITALAAMLYFSWRLTTFNPDAMFLSLALYAAELFGVLSLTLHAFMVWRLVDRKPPPPLENTSVDVFIPTYNEPIEMLRRTVYAAIHMNHPHETWLLDDGNRPSVAALAKELGAHYVARTENTHAKAGNLNNALSHSSGELIAIFDADHVPHKNFLVRTIGYFSDPKIAFVQTPQDFYNLDSFQHRRSIKKQMIWTEQSLFFRVIMRGKDYWNATFFCGSCATIRRAALADIGGFATETITEDLHTSIRLHKKGYGSIYHAESLAFGIAPDTFEPYESQRVRWGQGAMQVWRMEGILSAQGLTVSQRICYLASVLTYFDGWQKLFMYLLPAFVLVTGILPVANLDWRFVLVFVPWYMLSLWASEELGRGYARSWIIEQYNFLRCPGFLFATLTFFINRRLRFRVTKKEGSRYSENIRQLAPHLTIVAVLLGALVIGIMRFETAHHMTFQAFLFNLIWISLIATITISALLFALNRSKQERTTYRFHLPIPVRIYLPGSQDTIFTTEDISSGGFRLQLNRDFKVSPGDKLEADIILPSGLLPVTLEMRRCWKTETDSGAPLHNFAMQFLWPSSAASDMLGHYLYGTNTEWLFDGLREKGKTLSEWITSRLRSMDSSASKPLSWRPALLVPSSLSHSVEVLAHVDEDAGYVGEILAASLLLPGDATLILPQGPQRISHYRLLAGQLHETPEQAMFLHKLSQPAVEKTDMEPQPIWANEVTLAREADAA